MDDCRTHTRQGTTTQTFKFCWKLHEKEWKLTQRGPIPAPSPPPLGLVIIIATRKYRKMPLANYRILVPQIVTASRRSWGKVMFSQLSVCSRWRWVSPVPGPSLGEYVKGVGMSGEGGYFQGVGTQPPLPRIWDLGCDLSEIGLFEILKCLVVHINCNGTVWDLISIDSTVKRQNVQ